MVLHLKRILCPVDFSRSAAYATRYALAFAEAHGAGLFLLEVQEVRFPATSVGRLGMDGTFVECPPTRPEGLDTDSEIRPARKGDDLSRLAVDLRKNHQDVEIVALHTTGKPFVQIIRAARDYEVDLIVMGTHGRTGLAHMLVGSTAEKVVRMALCPVLTVKHPEHEFVIP